MYISASKLFLLSLIGYTVAAPSSLAKRAPIVIGFRSVQPPEKNQIAEDGTLIDDASVYTRKNDQTGQGKYTSDTAGVWNPIGTAAHCVVRADEAALLAMPKLWIYDDAPTFTTEEQMQSYIKNRWNVDDQTARTALRFSWIFGKGNTPQMMIPLVSLDQYEVANLNIQVTCYDTPDQATAAAGITTVNWGGWGVQGWAGAVPPNPNGPPPPPPPPAPPGPPGV